MNRAAPTWSCDGVPLAAQNIADGNGPVLRNVDWQSEIALRRCEATAPPPTRTISPQTRLSYRYDASAIGNLDDAWTLPGVLLVSDTNSTSSHDSAWRMGVAATPASASTWFPPSATRSAARPADSAGLAQAPVFAAVAGKRHKLASAAEIGALLVLARQPSPAT